MRPNSGSTIYRPDLGAVVIEAGLDPKNGLIGLLVMPAYDTPDDNGTFLVVPAEALLKLENVDRNVRGAFNRSDWAYEDGIYKCFPKGHEEPIDDIEFARLERRRPGLADQITTFRAMKIILMAQEKRIADKVFDVTRLSNTDDVTTAWDVAASADPATDIKDARAAFRSQCGRLPTDMVISWNTFENLKACAKIKDQLKYTFPGLDINRISIEQMARILDVPRILVGNVMYDGADKNQTRNLLDIWSDDYALLTITSRSEDLSEPCIGRTFVWTADSNVEPIVETYREEQITSDVYRVRHMVDERLIASVDPNTLAVKTDIAKSVSYLIGGIKTAEASA